MAANRTAGQARRAARCGTSGSDEKLRVNALHERKTATYTAVASDRGRLLEFDSASAVTLNLTAAATLSEGWFVYVNDSGAGALTIDPSGAETIDDVTTIALSQNQSTIVFCDGANFWTVGRTSSGGGLQSVQVFTASGTWTKPAGINTVVAEAVGAGGGGGGCTGGEDASGGGGGGYPIGTHSTV